MFRKVKRISIIILLIASYLSAVAQVSVKAEVDAVQMLIGQQVHLTLSVEAPAQARVEFPSFEPQQMITPGVEVLHTQHLDSHTSIYTLTSFDGKLYYLPPMTIKVDNKPYQTKSLALKVIEMEVDTTHMEQFFGPEDVQDNPFSWSEWRTPFLYSIVGLLLAALAFYLYVRLRDNKPIIAHIRIVKRLLPHQKAMREIEEIKASKMVSSENQKEYYTRLTDTLRKYIEERYGFSAMEMTSSEIIERLTASQDQHSLDELSQLFQTADLVKFAKYSTLINENDMNLVNAIDFINQTKIETQLTEDTVKPQLTAEQVRSQKTRRLLKILIGAISVVCFLLLAYAVYEAVQLM